MAATHYFLVFRGLLLDSNATEYYTANALNCAAVMVDYPFLHSPCEAMTSNGVTTASATSDCTLSILLLINVSWSLFAIYPYAIINLQMCPGLYRLF